ncbi:hypothetical protein ACFLSW_00815 [Candidatus Bipolaricaulota bacterium]
MPLSDKGVQAIQIQYGTVQQLIEHFADGTGPKTTSDLENSSAITAHYEASLLVLKIGKLLGYDTYSPDGARTAFGEKLDEYCTLKKLPIRFLGELAPIIREIDAIWFRDDVPKFAFEVEHTTKVASGFQRLLQLHPLSTKLFVISSEENRRLFDKYIETDPYYRHRSAFHFRNYSQLESFFRAVSQFDAISQAFLRGSLEPLSE